MKTIEEKRAYARAWYSKNRAKHKIHYQRWYQKNKTRQLAYAKEYYHTKVKNKTKKKREKRKYTKIDTNNIKFKRGEFILKFE